MTANVATAARTVTLTGQSGKQYTFNVYARSQKFNAIGAVYALAKIASGKYVIIYIGQTGDASNRPFNHHRTACFDRQGADLVFLLSESSEKRRLEIETDLIRAYDPPCNKQ